VDTRAGSSNEVSKVEAPDVSRAKAEDGVASIDESSAADARLSLLCGASPKNALPRGGRSSTPAATSPLECTSVDQLMSSSKLSSTSPMSVCGPENPLSRLPKLTCRCPRHTSNATGPLEDVNVCSGADAASSGCVLDEGECIGTNVGTNVGVSGEVMGREAREREDGGGSLASVSSETRGRPAPAWISLRIEVGLRS
jgi:hypothetical protein